jgi:transcriptional regulator with XRE-family HTH domain
VVDETKTQQASNPLRVLRRARELSQWKLAQLAGIPSFNRYCRIESGQTTPTQEERERLAAVFGVSTRKLFPSTPRKAA